MPLMNAEPVTGSGARRDDVWRLCGGAFGCVLTLCSLFGPSVAFGGPRLRAVPPPALPPAAGPAPAAASFIDLELEVPLATLRASLERCLPSEVRSASRVDTATVDALDAEGEAEREGDADREWKDRPIRWRGAIRRGPFETTVHADSLMVTAGLSWSVELLERELARTRCGSAAAPLLGSMGCFSRLGWSDDWMLETRARALPTRLSARCRPEPPGLDFTHRVNARIESALTSRLPARLDSVVRVVTDRSKNVRAAQQFLARPVMIGDSAAWLRWNPKLARVDPPAGAGESIRMHVTFEVQPSIEPGAAGEPVPSLPPPFVRLSGSGIRIPFDCWVEFADLERDFLSLPAGRTDRPQEMLQVTGARITGGSTRLAIALDLDGGVTGTAWLAGTLRVQQPDYLLVCPDLEWSPESLRALRDAVGAARWPAFRTSLETLRDAVRRRLRRPLTADIASWEKGLQDALQPAASSLTLQGGLSQREVGGVFCTDHAIGVRMLSVGRARLVMDR
jgi:hypothetical protein